MKVITVRGISEPIESPMLANVTKLIRNAEVAPIPYSAQYGPVPRLTGMSFDRTVAQGESLLRAELDKGPAVVLAYSAGALIAGNVAARGHRNIRAVGLISDPMRSTTTADGTWGIAGNRWIPGTFPVWQMADPKDVITCCPANSPLRTVSDQSSAFSLVDPLAWSWDLVERLRQQRWQATIRDWRNLREVWAAYSAAIDGAQGYLFARDHVSYGKRIYRDGRTYCEWLADRINEIRE